jgi:hypothetical protein
MKMKRLKPLCLLVLLFLFLVACAKEGDPAKTVESYLKARVDSDADKLRNLSCPEWEAQAMLQADSFRSMNARLEGMSCRKNGEDGKYTLVSCDGKIVTTYANGETREWELGTYRLVEDDGEWKMCGEANPSD